MVEQLSGFLRHALGTFLGGALVTRGIATEDEATTIVGSLAALIAVGLSLVSKRMAKAKLDKAIAAPAGKAE